MRQALADPPASPPNSDRDIVSVRMARSPYNSTRTVVTRDVNADGLTTSMRSTTQSTQTIPLAPGGPDMSNLMKNKAVVFAEVGHTVLLASSQKMLDKALAAYTSGAGSLADDPGLCADAQDAAAGDAKPAPGQPARYHGGAAPDAGAFDGPFLRHDAGRHRTAFRRGQHRACRQPEVRPQSDDGNAVRPSGLRAADPRPQQSLRRAD